MTRAIARAETRHIRILDHDAVVAFEEWVVGQSHPETRDVLGMLTTRLRTLSAMGSYADAASVADTIVETIRHADNTAGFDDVIPSTYLSVGTAKLLSGDVNGAVGAFAEAKRWTWGVEVHPMARFAAAHLALARSLVGRYWVAQRELDAPMSPPVEGPLAARLNQVEILARANLAVGALQYEQATNALADADEQLAGDDWWWMLAHVRAQYALAWGDRHEAIYATNTGLVGHQVTSEAGSLPALQLRADIADLHLANGDVGLAQRVLAGSPLAGPLRLVAARLELFRGRPASALAILDASDSYAMTPSVVVLRASAEMLASGSISPVHLDAARVAVAHHHAYAALADAIPPVRDQLVKTLNQSAPPIPNVFPYRLHSRLTEREYEVLIALKEHDSVSDLAKSLHVSSNTAKSHLRALYKKLGVHTRSEALMVAFENAAG